MIQKCLNKLNWILYCPKLSLQIAVIYIPHILLVSNLTFQSLLEYGLKYNQNIKRYRRLGRYRLSKYLRDIMIMYVIARFNVFSIHKSPFDLAGCDQQCLHFYISECEYFSIN